MMNVTHRQGLSDEGAKTLAIVIIKQAVLDWKQTIREPWNVDGVAELREYFRSAECGIHCEFADIDQSELIRKMDQLR